MRQQPLSFEEERIPVLVAIADSLTTSVYSEDSIPLILLSVAKVSFSNSSA